MQGEYSTTLDLPRNLYTWNLYKKLKEKKFTAVCGTYMETQFPFVPFLYIYIIYLMNIDILLLEKQKLCVIKRFTSWQKIDDKIISYRNKFG